MSLQQANSKVKAGVECTLDSGNQAGVPELQNLLRAVFMSQLYYERWLKCVQFFVRLTC